ncbi:MAG: hypothetical protein EPO21_18280 [Chloroflexota bacterium]|nr:MAG: hypothetical protein EPO21_18280 [Chloroflexota bacterium]
MRKALRRWLRRCYADREYIKKRLAAGAYNTSEDLFQQEKFPHGRRVQVADFAESVAHYILRRHPEFGFGLPIFRLQHKEDPESAMHGFDLLGFSFAELDGANILCIGEVKARTAVTGFVKDTIVNGHATLANYTRAREIQAVGRIAHWLFQTGDPAACDRLAGFGEGRATAPFERRHVLVGVFDAKLPMQDMLDRLEQTSVILPTFTAYVLSVENLLSWIQEAFAP